MEKWSQKVRSIGGIRATLEVETSASGERVQLLSYQLYREGHSRLDQEFGRSPSPRTSNHLVKR